MTYNFNLAVSATISSKVAEEMITKIVEEQTGKKVASIETKLRKVTKGIGPSESTETIFDGFHVFFQNEPVTKKETKLDNGFKVTSYE